MTSLVIVGDASALFGRVSGHPDSVCGSPQTCLSEGAICRVPGTTHNLETVPGTRLTAHELSAVLARVGAGDTKAFNVVYSATYAKLLSVSRSVIRDREAAEEILQDAYSVVWRKASDFDLAKGSAIAWLARIVRNRAIDELRAIARRRTTACLEAAGDLADDTASAFERLEWNERIVHLNIVLAGLEARQQAAIRDAFFGGFTYQQIAIAAGVPRGTMKSWIRRGIGKLRSELAREPVVPVARDRSGMERLASAEAVDVASLPGRVPYIPGREIGFA